MRVDKLPEELQQVEIETYQGITVSDDYNRVRHKPKINGVTLENDHTASELCLLSNQESEYKEITVGVDTKDSFLLVLGENGKTNKIKLEEVSKGRFSTVDNIDGEINPGDYVFKKVEENINGTNN